MAIRKVVAEKKKPARKSDDNTDYSDLVIQPVADVEEPLTALIYGKSGTGKTALAATFPKPMLILDIREKGTQTIKNIEGIDIAKCDTWADIEKAYWFLKSKDGKKYVTVVIDQMTAMQAVAMEKVREDKNLEPGDTLSQRDWGTMSGMLQAWIVNYRDLRDDGKQVVFLAHDRVRGETEGDATEGQIDPNVGARMMPSVVSFLNGAVDVIGNTYIREHFTKLAGGKKERKVQYCLRVGPHAFYDTKIRRPPDAGMLPDAIVNPSYKKLLAVSRGEDLKTAVKKKR